MKHSPTKRIRGRALMNIRRRLLDEEPLCRMCLAEDRITAAAEIDHIVPLAHGGEESDENRRPLCLDCHAKETLRIFGRDRTESCEHGLSIDYDDPWSCSICLGGAAK